MTPPDPFAAPVNRQARRRSRTVEDRRAQLRAQTGEPVITVGMTPAERRAAWEASQAQYERLDEENLILGLGWSASVSLTHELVWSWQTATAGRWYLALPERHMTPDDMARPDWDHRNYEHDEHGRIGRVTTRQRPKTAADAEAERMVAAILADRSAG
jgi:hypothetical protein